MIWFTSIAHAGYLPVQASSVAAEYDALYNFILVLSVISFIILMGGMIFFIVKYRRRSDKDKTAYITHNHTAELIWSVIPFLLFMVIFAWGYVIYHKMRTFSDDAININVTGRKWAWTVSYANGAQLVNELVVPVNKAVTLNLTSEDVLHSFYVPSFRVKQDAVPGKRSRLGFEAIETGDYRIFCAEYCGTQHSQMIGWVHVLSQTDYEAWEKAQASAGSATPVEKGEKLFKTQACFTCHSTDGTKIVGPTFKGIYGRDEKMQGGGTIKVDDAYIHESIVNPLAKIVDGYPPAMPSYQGRIKEEEISDIIEYLKTLK